MSRISLAAVLAISTCAFGVAPPALAESPVSSAEMIEKLQKRLNERDALIRSLIRRVDKLERQEAARPAIRTAPVIQSGTDSSQKSQAAAQPTSSGHPQPQVAQQSPSAAPPARPQARQPAASPPPSAQSSQQPEPNAGPGEFAVSPEAAQRALERALVQSGAGLLSPWSTEFVPNVLYQHNEQTLPGQIALSAATGTVLITGNVLRSTQLQGSGLFRVGLPWDSQAEISLPYNYKNVENTSRVLTAGIAQKVTEATGIGDPTLTFTKQLMAEKEWLPNFFLNGTWDSNFGAFGKGLALGTGFNELKAGLLATKRQDPLVFTAGFLYQKTFESRGIEPGDQFIPSVGLLFGISPETSLQVSQQLAFVNATKQNHILVPGSNQVEGIFNVGILSILGPGFVVNFNAGIGETPSAPNLTLQLSFPIRLN